MPVAQLVPFQYVDFGATSVTVEIAGFARVVNGVCDESTVTAEPSVFTSEQQADQLCMLGRISAGSLTIEKSLDGVDDGEFSFALEEFDQQSTPAAIDGTAQTVSLNTAGGAGSSQTLTLSPGTYRVSEITDALAEGVTPGPLSCTSDRGEGLVTIGGEEFVDVDSDASVVCSLTNTFVEPTDPTDPTEPSEPAEPTDPASPTEPTEPTDPTEPAPPAEPTESPAAAPGTAASPGLALTGSDGTAIISVSAFAVLLVASGVLLTVRSRARKR